MPELIKIYWRDIPSQVTAKAGRKTAKVMLPARFQEAIDRAAMRAGKGSSDAYMEDWRRDRSPCSGELQSEADAAAAQLIEQWDEESLETLTKAKGILANVGKSRDEIAKEAAAAAESANPEDTNDSSEPTGDTQPSADATDTASKDADASDASGKPS